MLDSGDSAQALEKLLSVLSVAPRHVPTLYLTARASVKEGNLELARDQLNRLLKQRPGHREARVALGNVSLALDDAPKAETLARGILEDEPMNLSANKLLAAALAAQGMHPASAGAYSTALEIDPDDAMTRMRYGVELARSGDLAGGITAIEAASEGAPEDVRLRGMLVRAYLASGEGEAARDEVDDFLAANPDLPDAHVLAGALYQAIGETPTARERFEKALELEPDNARARRALATLAVADNDPDAALALYAEALEADPYDLDSQMRMAALHERNGDVEAMERTLETAAERHPVALEPRLALGRYHYARGRPGKTVSLLTPIRNQHDEDPRIHQLLAGSYVAMGEAESAMASAARFLSLRPETALAHGMMAEAEVLGRKLESAEQHLREALAIADEVRVRQRLVDVLLLQDKLADADKELQKLPEDGRGAGRKYFLRGRIALAEGRNADARVHLERAQAEAPNSQVVLLLAGLDWQQGERDAAVALMKQWLEEHPDDTAVLNQLGGYYASIGDDAAAIPLLERLSEITPENAMVLNNLAWSYRTMDSAKALKLVERALELAPEAVQIQDTRAMILLAAGRADEALAIHDAILDRAAGNGQFALHRARILAALDRREEALTVLDELLAADNAPRGVAPLREQLAGVS